MKVLAINGSPRKCGNTSILINTVFNELKLENIDTELVSLSGQTLKGCTACGMCIKNKDKKCIINNDIVNSIIEKMIEADGIILASPTYFCDLTSELKAIIDRTGMVARANNHFLKRKIGAAVVAVRRAGAIHVFDSINHFFTISQMIIPGSSYWNLGIGREEGAVTHDEEGMATMKTLGQNIAWLLNKLK